MEHAPPTLHDLALCNDTAAIAKHLTQHGSSQVNITNDVAYTPLHFACSRGYAGVVRALLQAGAWVEGYPTTATAKPVAMPHRTPLHVACLSRLMPQSRDDHTVTLLLQAGADPNAVVRNGYKETALHLAAQAGRARVVAALLADERTMTEAVTSDDGGTALHRAAEMCVWRQHSRLRATCNISHPWSHTRTHTRQGPHTSGAAAD